MFAASPAFSDVRATSFFADCREFQVTELAFDFVIVLALRE
jgi:hypothetical protein